MVQVHPGAPDISKTTVVVLGVSRRVLRSLEKRLQSAQIQHVAIREPDPPWHGALMAIGLVPGQRDQLSRHLAGFQLLT